MERFVKFCTVIIITALIGCGVFVSFSLFVWDDVYEKLPTTQKTITVINAEGEEVVIDYKKQPVNKGNPFAMLLLGVDSEDVTKGRSDSIMLAIVQPKNDAVSLLSIPRDTYMTINSTGSKDKITHAHNNGVANTIATLEAYFNIPIDYYATINFAGFQEAVDAVDGVQINVPKPISFADRITNTQFNIDAGLQTMDGITALNYARYRGDAGGDFARNDRQKEVLSALVNKATDFTSISKINSLLSILKSNFKTNIKPDEMLSMLSQLNFGNNLNIENLAMKASPSRAGKMSIVVVEDSERDRVIQELHTRLEINALN